MECIGLDLYCLLTVSIGGLAKPSWSGPEWGGVVVGGWGYNLVNAGLVFLLWWSIPTTSQRIKDTPHLSKITSNIFVLLFSFLVVVLST